MRYAFAAAHRTRYPLGLLCGELRVSTSGFHDYLRRIKQSTDVDADAGVRAELRSIHTASRRTYGRRRLVKELRARNHRIGPKRVARLMAQEQICGKIKGGFKRRSAPAPSSLPATVGVEDQAGRLRVCAPGVVERPYHQFLGYTGGDAVTKHLSGLHAHNHGQVQPALLGWDIGDVTDPRCKA